MKDVPTESIDTVSQWCKELFVHKASSFQSFCSEVKCKILLQFVDSQFINQSNNQVVNHSIDQSIK